MSGGNDLPIQSKDRRERLTDLEGAKDVDDDKYAGCDDCPDRVLQLQTESADKTSSPENLLLKLKIAQAFCSVGALSSS